MSVYELARLPRITAGVGARERIATLAGAGGVALLVADSGLSATGLIDEVAGGLRKGGFAVSLFTAFQSDPTIAQADAAAAQAREAKAGVVVGLGGGSALDLAKAVAAVAPAPDSAERYQLFAHPLPAAPLRKICVPTTAGTGSETTRTAILTRADHAKVWLWGDEIKADEVVLDPELTKSLPPGLTAATGVDALVHAVEAATNRNSNPAANLYAYEAIRLVGRHLIRAIETPRRSRSARRDAMGGGLRRRRHRQLRHRDRPRARPRDGLAEAHPPRSRGRRRDAGEPAVERRRQRRLRPLRERARRRAGRQRLHRGLRKAAARLRLKLSVADEFAGVGAEALAAQAARLENAAMLQSNKRAASEADLLELAKRILSLS